MKFKYLAIIISISLFSCGCEKYHLSQGITFHTFYHIKYEFDRSLDKEIKAKLLSYNASLNPFNSTSIISKVNRNVPVEVDRFFTHVFDKAYDVAEQTHGAFDITCAPLVNLWGFGFQHIDNVSPEIIDSLKALVGYDKVRLENNRVIKDDQRTMLNCSAIAKGYATDVIAGLLDSCGIKNYMVEIGGEVRAKGKNPDGVCWRMEIPRPIDDNTGMISVRHKIIVLCDKSIATSGNYRNYYIKDGKKYAHTINPNTGYPAQNEILSATVIANDCMTADAYATAFMVLGLDASCQLVETLKETNHEFLDYYFIYTDEEGRLCEKASL